MIPAMPLEQYSALDHLVYEEMVSKQMHEHGESCRKTKKGSVLCRFGYPQPLVNQTGAMAYVVRNRSERRKLAERQDATATGSDGNSDSDDNSSFVEESEHCGSTTVSSHSDERNLSL